MRIDDLIPILKHYDIEARKIQLNRFRGIWILELEHQVSEGTQLWPFQFYSENPLVTEHQLKVIGATFHLPEHWWHPET